MKTVVTAPLVHPCPHKDELDVGRVELTFEGQAPELYGLSDYLQSFVSFKDTHEVVTDAIAEQYPTARVRTFWRTAGMEVEVTA